MAAVYLHNSELLSKVIEGDEVSFKTLHDTYRNRVFRLAYLLTKSEDTAADMTQEVFLKLWEMRADINTSLNFEAFLKTVTRNHVFNFLKKASRDKNLQKEIFAQMQMQSNSTEEQIAHKEVQQLYKEAIGKLPPQKKTIYTLSRIENLTHVQIAERLQISRNTVNNHLVEALRFIRNYLNNSKEVLLLILAFQFT